ncbi:MAG: cysteine protease [Verrucomicrobiales bacterium]|nr:cysteine protease [Verrucomicrobiales bacterium]
MEVVDTAHESVVRLHFIHETIYRYSGPVRFGPHRLVLRPRESHFERVEKLDVSVSPDARLHWYQDIYSNILARAELLDMADTLAIRSEFTICKYPVPDWAEEDEALQGEEYPAYYPGIEESASHLYRRSVYPPEVEAVRKWVRGLNVLPSTGTRAPIFERIAAAINERVGYQRREVSGVQSPTETLQKETGSCRDTAVLMMEAGRCIGFATRFVSGYLESQNSKVGKGSTHAWMEAYLPDRGWVGFDPSIGKPVGEGHVAVAVSHHPRGVMPISGSFEGLGNTALPMEVNIQSQRIS